MLSGQGGRGRAGPAESTACAPAENEVQPKAVGIQGIVGALARALKDRLAGCTSDAPAADKGLFVVAPHHVQIAAIRRALAADFAIAPLVDTVEKMQGRTCEVVIVSYGVSDPEVAMGEDEFIYDRNRLNVALSRARAKPVLVASRPLLYPPPRIIDRRSAALGFIYLRSIVAACDAVPEVFDLRLCGADTPVRLLGLGRALEP